MATGGNWAKSRVGDSDFIYDFECSPCAKDGKNAEAEYQCVECRTLFCQKCVEFHNRFLAAHTLLDKKAMKSGSGQKQKSKTPATGALPTITCDEHPGEVIKMFCGNHDRVCCTVCVAVKHRACEGVEYIPKIAGELVKDCDQRQTNAVLEEVERELLQLMSKRKSTLSMMNKERDDIVHDIKALKKRIVDRIEELENMSIEIVDSKHRKAVGCLNDDISSIEETLKMVTLQLDKLKQGTDNETQKFIDIKQSQTKTSDSKDILKQLERKQDESIVYELNTGIESILRDIESFVSIHNDEAHTQTPRTVPYTATFLGSHDIRIESDKNRNLVYGCCQLDDNQIIITDCDNDVIKRLDATFKVTDWVNVAGRPNRICQTGKSEVAVALTDAKKVQFVSVGKQLSLTRSFRVGDYCRGISFYRDELYISCGGRERNGPPVVKVYDMSDRELRVVQNNKAGDAIFSKPSAIAVDQNYGQWYVADLNMGLVTLDKISDQFMYTTEPTIKEVCGVCTDNRGNVFACGEHCVLQMDRRGKILGTPLTQTDGIKCPVSVTYLRNPDRLLITEEDSNLIKVYRLN